MDQNELFGKITAETDRVSRAANESLAAALNTAAINNTSFSFNNETKTWSVEVPEPTTDLVDLALPSGRKWSKYNVGATHADTVESWYGNYLSWAELTEKDDYNWGTYLYCTGTATGLTKYNTNSTYGVVDNKTTIEAVDDAATVYDSLRMPTKAEIEELISTGNTTSVWVTNYKGINGLNGFLYTSIRNGNHIFLPAAGGITDNGPRSVGVAVGMWSSTLGETPSNAYILVVSTERTLFDPIQRFNGFSVRGVQ